MLLSELGRYGERDRCLDELRRGCWLRAQLEDLRRERKDARLDQLGREADELELRLQGLEQRLQSLDDASALQLLHELELENLSLQRKIDAVLRNAPTEAVQKIGYIGDDDKR